MWSLGKSLHFTLDAVKVLFKDNAKFWKEDWKAAMEFVLKEKIWCILATFMALVVVALTIGVKFAIGYNDDYTRIFVEDTLYPDMKSLW